MRDLRFDELGGRLVSHLLRGLGGATQELSQRRPHEREDQKALTYERGPAQAARCDALRLNVLVVYVAYRVVADRLVRVVAVPRGRRVELFEQRWYIKRT